MMELFLVYSLKSALVLTLLYVPYTLMLRRERFFRLNRLTLIGILCLALILPFCKYSYSTTADDAIMAIVTVQQFVNRSENIMNDTSVNGGWSIWAWMSLLYILGVCVMLGIRVCQLLRIRYVIRRGSLWQQRDEDGTTVYCHAGDEPSFSWMRSIVVSQHDYSEHRQEVMLHERAHIRCRHSLDILLLTVSEIVQWWNPLVYLLGKSLRDVHEYEADNSVLQQDVSLSNYQQLLIRKALADVTLSIANHFNRSSVVKRINMMKCPPSNPWMRVKALYLLPLTAIVLAFLATPILEPLFVLDGETISREQMEQIPSNSISHIDVLKGTSATAVFGKKGTGGAIMISTKADIPLKQPTK